MKKASFFSLLETTVYPFTKNHKNIYFEKTQFLICPSTTHGMLLGFLKVRINENSQRYHHYLCRWFPLELMFIKNHIFVKNETAWTTELNRNVK